jgi:hypothetical protein
VSEDDYIYASASLYDNQLFKSVGTTGWGKPLQVFDSGVGGGGGDDCEYWVVPTAVLEWRYGGLKMTDVVAFGSRLTGGGRGDAREEAGLDRLHRHHHRQGDGKR